MTKWLDISHIGIELGMTQEKIVLYGFGKAGKAAVDYYEDSHDIRAICTTTRQSACEYRGIPLITPDALAGIPYDRVIIASTYNEEITATLREAGVAAERIFTHAVGELLTAARKKAIETFVRIHPATVPLRGDSRYWDTTAVEAMMHLDGDTFTPIQWNYLNDLMVTNCRFHDALLCRQKAIDGYRNVTQFDEPVSALQKYLSFIDTGELNTARAMVDSLKETAPEHIVKPLMVYEFLRHIWENDIDSAKKCAWGYGPRNEKFKKLIGGKRVAVVGPAESDAADGKEIDSYDVVVRLTPVPIQEAYRSKIGGRTDVVYVKGISPALFSKEVIPHYDREDIFFIYEKILTSEQRQKTEKQMAMPIGLVCDLFNGVATLLQRLLQVFMVYEPASIKIFKFDFYTGKSLFNQNYRKMFHQISNAKTPEESRLILALLAAGHDPASNFIFTQQLCRNGVFTADDCASTVLDMTVSDYYATLETRFAERVSGFR